MFTTTRSLLDRADVTCAVEEVLADIEVPIVAGPQRQGDVGVFPRPALTPAERQALSLVPAAGIPVVRGESGVRNSHVLLADGPVSWASRSGGIELGVLDVPEGSTAHLIHTDEHSAISIAPGTYRVTGKREQADEIRRVAD